jgi:hypothetical protein
MASNLDKLAAATEATPVVVVAEDGTVTITLHTESATYSASGESTAAAARLVLDALDA